MPARQGRVIAIWVVVAALFVVGLGTRIAPLLNQDGRLLRQWPTEDGYLMLTIARNVALGRGMSVSAGTIETNGTQPLFSAIEAVGFAAVGGDRSGGVLIALVLQILIGIGAAGFLYRLARQALEGRTWSREASWLCAALWFSSSTCIHHTMNCLETALYVACILASLVAWHGQETRTASREGVSWSVVWVGALLGLTFWARNDAVFFIAAVTVVHALLGLADWRKQLWRRTLESVIMGLLSVLIASPWLINNRIRFGSIVPISGPAQSETSSFASNLFHVPAKLFEQGTIVLPVPKAYETLPLVVAGACLFVVLYVVVLALAARRMRRGERVLLAVGAVFAVLLTGYYGLFFGASHFVNRYLFPLSPIFALASAALAVQGLARWRGEVFVHRALPVAGVALLLVNVGLNARRYYIGRYHEHFQVVAWVEEHVDERTWVGAIQTGTLGFFHDRTVNLDGKVNPHALEARRGQGIPRYVVEQIFDEDGGRIEYLADWQGIATWADLDPIDDNFQLIVDDRENNLAVLARR